MTLPTTSAAPTSPARSRSSPAPLASFARARACWPPPARVALADRDGDGARALADELGAQAIALDLDVADRDSIESALAATEAQLGVPDILVNSAGIGACTAFWESDPDEFDYVLRVNLTGTFLAARAFTRRLLAVGRRGAIVNIASTNAFIPATGLAAYCASKGGVLMFTRVAAMELGARGIRVNAIAPGSTLTGLTTMAFTRPQMEQGFLRHTPMGASASPKTSTSRLYPPPLSPPGDGASPRRRWRACYTAPAALSREPHRGVRIRNTPPRARDLGERAVTPGEATADRARHSGHFGDGEIPSESVVSVAPSDFGTMIQIESKSSSFHFGGFLTPMALATASIWLCSQTSSTSPDRFDTSFATPRASSPAKRLSIVRFCCTANGVTVWSMRACFVDLASFSDGT
jgi:NAD(P)-dependent dehydrogenase (short-subunit alcohol dehydrogenase family)